MSKLGEVGSQDVIMAMLQGMPILEEIAHMMWEGEATSRTKGR